MSKPTIATCPRCRRDIAPNETTWPVCVDARLVEGGCQECWEEECAQAWWDAGALIESLDAAIAALDHAAHQGKAPQ
jgi:hypothetical protein